MRSNPDGRRGADLAQKEGNTRNENARRQSTAKGFGTFGQAHQDRKWPMIASVSSPGADWLVLAMVLAAFLIGLVIGVSVAVIEIWWDRKLRARLRCWRTWKRSRESGDQKP